MTDPPETPLSTLVERLRNTAINLTTTYVATDSNGEPLQRPGDGSEEGDFNNHDDPVEFEPEELHDLARLCREAATALEQAQAELAVLRVADPPNRAPLLAQLEELTGPEMLSAGGKETVDTIRDAIAAIRTDARVIEVARGTLKDWHGWARKLARAETDEHASAMPVTLQTRIAGQVEAGELALRILPIRRRVELVQALCSDIGLGAEEAGDIAPRAALWTDTDVAEIEDFRARDWTGTGLNPFDHLPAALERTMYPGPGGRLAFLQRIGDPLPLEDSKPEERQLGLPGLPKPETAMRLRLALINKPDGPESALVAYFAQALLEKLDKAGVDRGPGQAHAWMRSDWSNACRQNLRQHVEKGDPRDVAAYCAFAWHHGWSLAAEQGDLEALHAVLTSLLNAEPVLDLEVFPVTFATGEHKLEGESGLEMAARLLVLARQRGAFDQRSPADLPSPKGYTAWVSMGNSGWALNGVRVANDVLDAWAHAWGLRPKAVADLRELVEAAARRSLGQRPVVDALVATCLWELLEAIEKTDPTDTEMSKVQFRGAVRELARRRHDLMTKEAVRAASGG